MKQDLIESLPKALSAVGVGIGDIAFIHSDMRSLGMPRSLSSPKELLPYYLHALKTAVGLQGTLATPAYFYEYARFGIPFDVDSSPVSLSLGSFSRYLATQPGRVRSCNPLQSIAAIGALAQELAGGDSLIGYGVTSPWHRLRMMGGKLLFLGVSLQPMTYVHYIEEQYGVPHLYHKLFFPPVLRNGKELHGRPISAVRYLDYGITYDLSQFEKQLIKEGILKVAMAGDGTIRAASAQEIYDCGIRALEKNPYFFLKNPPHFVPGKIPFDGPTEITSEKA